jgi:type VI secretion system protein ImpJ
MAAATSLRKPLWPPSGKLWPQNRQFPDTFAEDLVSAAFDAVAANGWGLARLVIDEAALGRGVVRITEARGRFASGAPLVITPDATLVRELPRDRDIPRVTMSLGIARESIDAPNVTGDAGEAAAVRHERTVRRDGGASLRPLLRLFLDDEGGDAYERMPLASVVLSAQPRLDPWFAPPLLALLPGSKILQGVHEVVASLAARRHALVADRRARPLDLRAFDPTRAPQLLLLSIVNRALAVLEERNMSTKLTPEVLHDLLVGLLGALEALENRSPAARPAYVHEAAGPGFRELVDRLVALIPDVVRSTHRVLPFARKDASTFALSLDDAASLGRRVYLVTRGVHEQWTAPHLPAHAKIASAATLPTIMDAAVRGVPIALEFEPPPYLPSSAIHCVFRIDTRGPYWTDVMQLGSLQVHVPQAPPELELFLYYVPATSAEPR